MPVGDGKEKSRVRVQFIRNVRNVKRVGSKERVGEVIETNLATAKRLESAGQAVILKPGEDAQEVGGRERTELAELSKDELVEIAEARGLEVTRGDGKDGDPLKDDYLRALEAEGEGE